MSLIALEGRGRLQVLAYLHGRTLPATVTELREQIPCSLNSVYSALEILKKYDLISMQQNEEFPFSMKIKLTSRGEKLGDHLMRIKHILEAKS